MKDIKGKSKILLGYTKLDNEPIYLTKPQFDCGWYWAHGHIGNENYHSHLNHIDRNKNLYDAIKNYLTLQPKIKENLWQLCEIELTLYTLCAASEIFYRGGFYMCKNINYNSLKNKELYEKLAFDLIPTQCQSLWDIIGGNG